MKKHNNYEAVIFDWDGYVAQSLHVWLQGFRDTYNELSLSPSDADITSRFGHWGKAEELGVPLQQVDGFNTTV